MKSFFIDPAEAACGAIFIGFGAFFALQSFGLDLGTTFRMGPGYFPLVLAIVLILLGSVIFFRATRVQGDVIGAIAWRGIFFILPAPIFFGFTVRGLGFVPALFFSALIAAFASHKMSPLMAVVISAAITVFSVAVFNYGLGLPFQRFGPWLKF
ncbi:MULTISPECIES: tripartite tricarboxylate transporter TctB family protein [Agrobacterium]|uniref:tripartite tricarboxylate transporter TctB family protein n=1 Tax=Agrobacterium TaxID=357 RepID=UPI001295512A|nr:MULTISPECIES: tripartite tricarboxylate transporter TctB family protein [Agrobacterium]MQB11129.1 tripartite tricarboxylate transporter TctB family protein [Agrobacterium sp. ICMP 6402]NTZ91684.1 tripartite tricarboxylate transporter TctB family protein [Agrobacterium tumefaciens]